MPLAKLRHVELRPGHLSRMPHEVGAPRTVVTLGDLVSAAYGVAGTAEGTARLLGASSPLGQLIDRRIVFG
jgi:hypothetical protein